MPVVFVSGSITVERKGGPSVEIPKAMIVERIRSRSGAEAANQADNELPDKIDSENDAELLRKYDLDPEELNEEFRDQSPAAG
jgi:hypothetical protein